MLSILQLLTKSELASVIESKLHGMLEASADLGELEKVPSPRILNTHMMPGLMPKQHFEKVLLQSTAHLNITKSQYLYLCITVIT